MESLYFAIRNSHYLKYQLSIFFHYNLYLALSKKSQVILADQRKYLDEDIHNPIHQFPMAIEYPDN